MPSGRRSATFRRSTRWLARLLALITIGFASSAHCDDLQEYRLKAAFLYNFAAFTDWPADVGRALNVCLFGGNPFGPVIDAINGKTVGGRIVALQRNVNTDTVAGCQVVFVPAAVNAQLPAVLQTVRSLPVLVVAESAGAAGQGATINMSVIQNRVVFEANLGAARRARLGLNARLLRLATEVIQ